MLKELGTRAKLFAARLAASKYHTLTKYVRWASLNPDAHATTPFEQANENTLNVKTKDFKNDVLMFYR